MNPSYDELVRAHQEMLDLAERRRLVKRIRRSRRKRRGAEYATAA